MSKSFTPSAARFDNTLLYYHQYRPTYPTALLDARSSWVI